MKISRRVTNIFWDFAGLNILCNIVEDLVLIMRMTKMAIEKIRMAKMIIEKMLIEIIR